MSKQETLQILNRLIHVCEDGRIDFANAARHATLASLQTVFLGRSMDCGSAVVELRTLVAALGGAASERGTLTGTIRRNWGVLKQALGDLNLAILEELEQEEAAAISAYQAALAGALPESIRRVVQRQSEGAQHNHTVVRDLRDIYRHQIEEGAH